MKRLLRKIILVGLLASLLLTCWSEANAQQPISPEYLKALKQLFDGWNKKTPQTKQQLMEVLVPSLMARVEKPLAFYEDKDWYEDILVLIDKQIPPIIKPGLSVSEDAMKRYTTFFQRARLPFYSTQVSPTSAYQDLTAKFYFLMVIAERNAINAKANKIEFRHIRRALFIWESGLWPIC